MQLVKKKCHVYYVRKQAFLYVTLSEENRSTAVKGGNSRTLSLAIVLGSGRLPLRFHGTTLLYYKGFFLLSGWFLFYRYPHSINCTITYILNATKCPLALLLNLAITSPRNTDNVGHKAFLLLLQEAKTVTSNPTDTNGYINF